MSRCTGAAWPSGATIGSACRCARRESYRQLLLKDLHLVASARALSSWLTVADPTAAESQSAAEAALALMDVGAERGDWVTVVRLASTAERALFIAGRWEAWHHALGQGLAAARASADRAAEAFFSHQQGTLALCHDQLDEARRLLQHAVTLREQIGDNAGADVTHHNLRLLEPPDPPQPPRRRVPRRALTMAGSAVTTLALAAGAVAITGALRSGQPHGGQPTGPPNTSPAVATSPGQRSNPGQGQGQSQGQGQVQGQGQGQGQRDLQFTPQTLPAATVEAAVSQQITASGGTPPYTFSSSGPLPPGLTLSSNGAIRGTPTTAGNYRFMITATDSSNPANSGSQRYTLQVAPVTITLSPSTLSAATVGAAVSQQITASGGTPPYTFSSSGPLPPGLTLSSNGAISGTPTTVGSYQFTMKATDASGTSSGSQSYTLQVGSAPVTITLSPLTLPATSGCLGYKAQITAGGGTSPYTYSWSGTLPPGLTLSSNGAISGAPTAVGSYQFKITATDSSSTPNSGSQSYTLAEACTGVGY